MLFGQFADTLSLRLLRDARSHVACVAVAGFGSNVPHRFTLPRLIHGFGYGQLQVRWARSGDRASVFGKLATALPSPASGPPNKSFKPTPHRGVNSVLCATLHAVATPTWGGLTQALGANDRNPQTGTR